MRDLSLDNTDVDDGAVEMLSGLRDLRSLNLYHTLVTETGIEALRAGLPGCLIAWDRESSQPTRRR